MAWGEIVATECFDNIYFILYIYIFIVSWYKFFIHGFSIANHLGFTEHFDGEHAQMTEINSPNAAASLGPCLYERWPGRRWWRPWLFKLLLYVQLGLFGVVTLSMPITCHLHRWIMMNWHELTPPMMPQSAARFLQCAGNSLSRAAASQTSPASVGINRMEVMDSLCIVCRYVHNRLAVLYKHMFSFPTYLGWWNLTTIIFFNLETRPPIVVRLVRSEGLGGATHQAGDIGAADLDWFVSSFCQIFGKKISRQVLATHEMAREKFTKKRYANWSQILQWLLK